MKIKTADVAQTASASTVIFDALREAIISGDLEDGKSLRQEEIGRMFNTSRIPVREAILRLEQEGLVTTARFKGAVVAGVSGADVEELFDLRVLLEGALIRKAVPLMTSDALNDARMSYGEFAASDVPAKWGEFNQRFHSALYVVAQCPNHTAILNTIHNRIDRYLRAQLVLMKGKEIACREHGAILQACADGNAELAGTLTEQHILGAKQNLLDFVHSQRDGGGVI